MHLVCIWFEFRNFSTVAYKICIQKFNVETGIQMDFHWYRRRAKLKICVELAPTSALIEMPVMFHMVSVCIADWNARACERKLVGLELLACFLRPKHAVVNLWSQTLRFHCFNTLKASCTSPKSIRTQRTRCWCWWCSARSCTQKMRNFPFVWNKSRL